MPLTFMIALDDLNNPRWMSEFQWLSWLGIRSKCKKQTLKNTAWVDRSCSEGHCRTNCETRERRGEKLRATPPGMGSPVWNTYIHPSDNKNVRVRRKQRNPKLRFLVRVKDTACQPPGGPDVGHCSTAVSLARCWHREAALIPLERTHSGRMKSNDGSGQCN